MNEFQPIELDDATLRQIVGGADEGSSDPGGVVIDPTLSDRLGAPCW